MKPQSGLARPRSGGMAAGVCLFPVVIILTAAYASAAVTNKPFCGLYCVYAAGVYYGKNPDCNNLFTSLYLGSPEGSSASELLASAEQIGLHGKALQGLLLKDLRHIKNPMILHVKSAPAERLDHYILFLGEVDEGFFVYDPLKSARVISCPELASIWQGHAIMLKDSPSDIGYLLIRQAMRRVIVIFALSSAVIGVYILTRRRNYSIPTVCQFSLLIGCSLLIAWFQHGVLRNGILRAEKTLDSFVADHRSYFIPRIGREKLRRLLESEGVGIVDARSLVDYNQGHIASAINIPANRRYDCDVEVLLSEFEKSAKMVVYCQSDRCSYADDVSSYLLEKGYSNVYILNGGWVNWKH